MFCIQNFDLVYSKYPLHNRNAPFVTRLPSPNPDKRLFLTETQTVRSVFTVWIFNSGKSRTKARLKAKADGSPDNKNGIKGHHSRLRWSVDRKWPQLWMQQQSENCNNTRSETYMNNIVSDFLLVHCSYVCMKGKVLHPMSY